MTYLRFAVCNEIFGRTPFEQSLDAVQRAGFEGIEIAPFTLAADPAALSPSARQQIRTAIQDHGLQFAGLHWLLATPPGLHLTTPDPEIRSRSWDYLLRMIDLCADLGGGVLVLGSPRQRSSTGGLTREQATANLIEGLARLAPYAAGAGCCLLLEALSPDQTDVVTTLEEAASIVHRINHPGLATLFDTHNAVMEKEPHPQLLARYFPIIRHIHLNEPDGGPPGQGSYDFRSILKTLVELNYQGWVSLEIFGEWQSPEQVIASSLRYLKNLLEPGPEADHTSPHAHEPRNAQN